MAYISAKSTRMIKKALKETFPEFTFSVRNEDHTSVGVTIKSGPTDFGYHLQNYENSELLTKMLYIINTSGEDENFDKSDSMTDYFHVGYYVHMEVGTWEKPFVKTAA
jgi:hypothetical protein